jgi:hypothetical protein
VEDSKGAFGEPSGELSSIISRKESHMANPGFSFEHRGIGELISRGRLIVPINQRAYAWEEKNVLELLQDLSTAIKDDDRADYFLGTVVLVGSEEEPPQIADGQQRIATTSIIMARIRDMYQRMGRHKAAEGIEDKFVQQVDIDLESEVPRLEMNDDDNQYFRDWILSDLSTAKRSGEALGGARRPSNRRLLKASDIVRDFLINHLASFSEELRPDVLKQWVKFIEKKVTVVVVTVPDEVGAFRMFETLNDRGLRASQADILKNYLFSRTNANRLGEAHALWNGMVGTIASLPDDEDDNVVRYIRHYWITQDGITRVKDLASTIRTRVGNDTLAIRFLTEARNAANDYVALWSPAHPKWHSYSPDAVQYLRTLMQDLRAEQIVPLVFSVARHFTSGEAEKAFRLFVSWSVRFLIFGGGKGGRIEKPYCDLAQKVASKEITKARQLREFMKNIVPTDREFEDAFAFASVSKTYLARYYLRAIDKTLKDDPKPEYVANEDALQINLEHVMPASPGDCWRIEADVAEANYKLIGNMVLLSSDKNTLLGNEAFDVKRNAYGCSGYEVTKDVSAYEQWTLSEIRERQAKLAKVAVRTWSLSFD